MISDLAQDFRYASRVLFKSPVYALVSVITLTLGIGASTAIFSVVYGVLLQPLPYEKPEQIVRLWEVNAQNRPMQFADPNFADIRAQASSLFTALRATWRDVQSNLVEGGRRQGTGVRSRRTGRMIVAAQVAITL